MWVVAGFFVFVSGFVLLLVMIKPGPSTPWTIQGLMIPVATLFLLFIAATLIVLSADASFESLEGFEIKRVKEAAALLGAGIFTGVVAGAVLGVVERWHRYEGSGT